MYKMRGGSSPEVVDSKRRNAEQRMIYNVGVTSLTHINRKTNIRQNTWIGYWFGSVGRSLGLREGGVDSKYLSLRLLAIFICDGGQEVAAC